MEGEFVVDKNDVSSKCEKHEKSLNDLVASNQVNVDCCVAQPLKDYFCCGICLHVISNPVECNGCEKLFCKKCIETYFESQFKTECPNCRQHFKHNGSLKTMNIHLKNDLNETGFKCDNCEEDFKFD